MPLHCWATSLLWGWPECLLAYGELPRPGAIPIRQTRTSERIAKTTAVADSKWYHCTLTSAIDELHRGGNNRKVHTLVGHRNRIHVVSRNNAPRLKALQRTPNRRKYSQNHRLRPCGPAYISIRRKRDTMRDSQLYLAWSNIKSAVRPADWSMVSWLHYVRHADRKTTIWMRHGLGHTDEDQIRTICDTRRF